MAHDTDPEYLDVLVRCNEHLRFATEIIKQSALPKSIQVEIQQQITRIQLRQQDDKLYLAVIGEFSSGKSTFINALLRDELLKTSALVTTVAATKICYGNDLSVEVRFQKSEETVKIQGNARKIKVPGLPGVNGVDLRRFIHLVASEKEVAQQVIDLTIKYPEPFLANGIVVIDTPGTNAIDFEHGEITRRVVEQEADCAIIIVPATASVSQTLTDFLASSLRPYLHRCIFVVTRMDQIKPQEQSELLENIRTRLGKKLGIKPPVLHLCSAQIVIDDLNGEDVPASLLVWKKRFAQLENILINRLSKERLLSIAESLLRLLNQLFEQLNNHLQIQWKQYQEHQVAIERELIPDLTLFATEQYAICHQNFTDKVSSCVLKVSECVENHRDSMIDEIRSTLFEITDAAELNDLFDDSFEDFLNDDQHSLQKQIKKRIKKLSKAATKIGQYFDQKFAEVYQRLQALGGQIDVSEKFNRQSISLDISDVLDSAQSVVQTMDESDGGKRLGGAATGLVIGSFIFPVPVIGTIAGGIIGGLLSGFFMPSLEERKQRIWESMSPELDNYFDEIQLKAIEATQEYAQTLQNSLEQRIKLYLVKYQSIVDSILHDQKTELQRLTLLQESTQANLQEIERRKQQLSKQRQRIAAMK